MDGKNQRPLENEEESSDQVPITNSLSMTATTESGTSERSDSHLEKNKLTVETPQTLDETKKENDESIENNSLLDEAMQGKTYFDTN